MSVVWLNGPVGSGKSTLAYSLRALVHPVSPVVILDEDAIKQAIADTTPGAQSDRASELGRLSGTALVLAQQGFVVVVAASDTSASVRTWNRANLPGYREIYLKASPETIKHRNRRHRATEALEPAAPAQIQPANLSPGAGTAPDPDLTVDMDNPEPPELLAFRVAVLIPEYVVAAAGAAGYDTHRLRRGA